MGKSRQIFSPEADRIRPTRISAHANFFGKILDFGKEPSPRATARWPAALRQYLARFLACFCRAASRRSSACPPARHRDLQVHHFATIQAAALSKSPPGFPRPPGQIAARKACNMTRVREESHRKAFRQPRPLQTERRWNANGNLRLFPVSNSVCYPLTVNQHVVSHCHYSLGKRPGNPAGSAVTRPARDAANNDPRWRRRPWLRRRERRGYPHMGRGGPWSSRRPPRRSG